MAEESAAPSARAHRLLWVGLLVGVPALLLLAWWPAPPKPRPALPSPNGYDYFVKAGAALTPLWTNLTVQELTAFELQGYVSANQASLDLVREGLRHQSHTHVDYDATYLQRMLTNAANFKQLARLFAGEGHLAELEGKPVAALEAYYDGMRFGQACGRGGVFIERLVGVAVEMHIFKELRTLTATLDVSDLRRALEQLQRLDDSHESAKSNLDSESIWVKQTTPMWSLLLANIHPGMRKGVREVRESLIQKVDALQTARRHAIVEAAARLFEFEQGRRAKSYADLVPAYLPAAPLDPATGKALAHPF
jgi:hypothetical protein